LNLFHVNEYIKANCWKGSSNRAPLIMKISPRLMLASLLLLGIHNTDVFGQVECTGQGNLRGIRVDGELMAFTGSIRVVASAAASTNQFGRGRGGGEYSHDNGGLIVTGNLAGGGGRRGRRGGVPAAGAGASYRATYEDVAAGTVAAKIEFTAATNAPIQGVYYDITLPGTDYAGGSVQWIAPASSEEGAVSLAGTNFPFSATAQGVRVISARRQIQINLPTAAELVIQNGRGPGSNDIEVSFPLNLGTIYRGQDIYASFTVTARGEVDKSPAHVAVDMSQPGRTYDGMGGNFRLQSPADPPIIQYNLDHLRVAWGRVAMPFNLWQTNMNIDPVQAAAAGHLNTNVSASMEMAQKLAQKNIPFVASLWFPPGWAVANGGGPRGRAPINPARWDKVCQSISSYLEYMKTNYGAEADLFSFNESDMGINVLQTPEQHDETIKRLGAYFAAHGLKTKLLLGDTGNPRDDKFIDVAAADPEAARYIGAVSFHSWGGGTAEQYTHFSDAARKLNVPLLVCEGGLDPAAYLYRATLLEPWYCLNEIAQYVEICRVAQPLSILPWQLTSDYSILTGGPGGGPLEPAQRFWQIKQLGMTAAGSTSVPVTCDNSNVVSCAFDDHGTCVVHLVNNGAARTATVTGLPADVKEMRVIVTDKSRGMQETGRVPVVQGRVELPLDAMSFTSLAGNP
jgi:Glycosyl hydrolase family 30 TIM-barrel domain